MLAFARVLNQPAGTAEPTVYEQRQRGGVFPARVLPAEAVSCNRYRRPEARSGRKLRKARRTRVTIISAQAGKEGTDVGAR